MREIEEEVFGTEEPPKEKTPPNDEVSPQHFHEWTDFIRKSLIWDGSFCPLLGTIILSNTFDSHSFFRQIKMKGQQRKQTPRQPLFTPAPPSPILDRVHTPTTPFEVPEVSEDPILQILKQNYGKHRFVKSFLVCFLSVRELKTLQSLIHFGQATSEPMRNLKLYFVIWQKKCKPEKP